MLTPQARQWVRAQIRAGIAMKPKFWTSQQRRFLERAFGIAGIDNRPFLYDACAIGARLTNEQAAGVAMQLKTRGIIEGVDSAHALMRFTQMGYETVRQEFAQPSAPVVFDISVRDAIGAKDQPINPNGPAPVPMTFTDIETRFIFAAFDQSNEGATFQLDDVSRALGIDDGEAKDLTAILNRKGAFSAATFGSGKFTSDLRQWIRDQFRTGLAADPKYWTPAQRRFLMEAFHLSAMNARAFSLDEASIRAKVGEDEGDAVRAQLTNRGILEQAEPNGYLRFTQRGLSTTFREFGPLARPTATTNSATNTGWVGERIEKPQPPEVAKQPKGNSDEKHHDFIRKLAAQRNATISTQQLQTVFGMSEDRIFAIASTLGQIGLVGRNSMAIYLTDKGRALAEELEDAAPAPKPPHETPPEDMVTIIQNGRKVQVPKSSVPQLPLSGAQPSVMLGKMPHGTPPQSIKLQGPDQVRFFLAAYENCNDKGEFSADAIGAELGWEDRRYIHDIVAALRDAGAWNVDLTLTATFTMQAFTFAAEKYDKDGRDPTWWTSSPRTSMPLIRTAARS